jgi:hypothetical protein
MLACRVLVLRWEVYERSREKRGGGRRRRRRRKREEERGGRRRLRYEAAAELGEGGGEVIGESDCIVRVGYSPS